MGSYDGLGDEYSHTHYVSWSDKKKTNEDKSMAAVISLESTAVPY